MDELQKKFIEMGVKLGLSEETLAVIEGDFASGTETEVEEMGEGRQMGEGDGTGEGKKDGSGEGQMKNALTQTLQEKLEGNVPRY